jgi:hypothetical protein
MTNVTLPNAVSHKSLTGPSGQFEIVAEQSLKQGGQTEPQGRIPDVRTQRYSNYKFTRHYSDG